MQERTQTDKCLSTLHHGLHVGCSGSAMQSAWIVDTGRNLGAEVSYAELENDEFQWKITFDFISGLLGCELIISFYRIEVWLQK